MDTSINIAISGLNAASLRLNNSANNVANATTTGYIPTDVTQSSINLNVGNGGSSGGGVKASIVERSPATVTSVDGGNPDLSLQAPNVSAEDELIQQKLATYNFQGSLKVLKAANEMLGNLLDISA